MDIYPEGLHLEYKTGTGNLPKDFWATYSAFSNTKGGEIIFGITEEKKFEYKITGAKNILGYKEQIFNDLNNKEKVSFNSITEDDIEIIDYKNTQLLKVSIKEAPYQKKPVYINNRINSSYKRQGDANQLLTEEEIRYYFANSQSHTDNEILETYSIDDLNINDVHKYKEIISEKSEIDYSSLNDIEFLKKIGAYLPIRSKTSKEYFPTIACLLFFGKYNSIIELYPKFQLDYFQKKNNTQTKWNDRVSSGDMNFPEMNIFSFYQNVLPKLYQNIEDKFIQDEEMQRTSYVLDMRSAVREAFINMLMHAYYGQNSQLKVTAFEDYFEFYNPGDMRVSTEQFLMGGTSNPRNGILSNLFRRIGLAEKAGYGGQRILDVAQKNSLKTPDIISENYSTTIRLWKVDFAHSLPEELSDEAKRVYLYLYERRIAKKKKIEVDLNLSEHKSRTAIDELRKGGYIRKEGKSRATIYVFNFSQEMQTSQNVKLIRQLEDWYKNK